MKFARGFHKVQKVIEFLKNNGLPNVKHLGGFFIGEKVIYCAGIDKFVYVCGDFVTASKMKKGLQDCGKKVEIVSCGRENDNEKDINLLPFAHYD